MLQIPFTSPLKNILMPSEQKVARYMLACMKTIMYIATMRSNSGPELLIDAFILRSLSLYFLGIKVNLYANFLTIGSISCL